MKTDKFEESLRRKLESIDPPYQERDWTVLQSFLRERGVTSVWPNPVQWLMPVVSAAAVVSLLVSTVWLYRDNRQKDQTIAALKKAVQRPVEAPVVQRDTVYVTRHVENTPADRPLPTIRQPRSLEKIEQESTAPKITSSVERQRMADVNQSSAADAVRELPPDRPDVRAVPERVAIKQPTQAAEPGRQTASGQPDAGEAKPLPADDDRQRVSERVTPDTRLTEAKTRSNTSSTPATGRVLRQQPVPYRPDEQVTDSRSVAAPPAESTGLSGQWTPLATRPLQFDTTYFVERYERRSRRIHPSLPTYADNHSAGPHSEAVNPVVENPESGVQFRLGPGAEVGIGQQAYGLTGEVLFNRRWALSFGLGRSVLVDEQFLTDIQFNQRTRRDFRREYAPGIPLQHEISNIDRRSVNLMLPVSLGYRLPLRGGVTLVSSVGANLSLSSRERITFTYRRGPGDINQSLFVLRRSSASYHTWALSASLEKEWSAWVLQAGPYFTVPFQTDPKAFNTPTAGLRVRLMYRF